MDKERLLGIAVLAGGFLWKIPRRTAILLIRIYQMTLSPDHGPLRRLFRYGVCRYRPTCSEYTKQALEKYGLIRGSAMGFWRVLRCNPWSHGGHDPIK